MEGRRRGDSSGEEDGAHNKILGASHLAKISPRQSSSHFSVQPFFVHSKDPFHPRQLCLTVSRVSPSPPSPNTPLYSLQPRDRMTKGIVVRTGSSLSPQKVKMNEAKADEVFMCPEPGCGFTSSQVSLIRIALIDCQSLTLASLNDCG